MDYLQSDHKVGFVLSRNIKDEINAACSLNLAHRSFYKLWNENDSQDRYICMIRHPYEVITSAYLFHQICDEEWATTLGFNYYQWYLHRFPKDLSRDEKQFVQSAIFSHHGVTYQDQLKNMSTEEGLIFEMEHVSRLTIEGMYEYKYFGAPNVLVVRFEKLMEDYDKTISSILAFLGIPPNEDIMNRLRRHDIRRIDVSNIRHVTNKKHAKCRYREYFTPRVYEHFDQIYPSDVLERLGYIE